MTRVGWLRRLGDARVALGAFVAVQLVAIPLLLSWSHKLWFWADDWDFLAGRTGGDFGDLFRAHYQHWTTLPILAYRLLWWIFGIRSYVPYELLVIVLHLAVAGLLRIIMVRVGVRPWMATLAAGVFVFFGAGAENILIAFQITFVGALVFGLGQLLLADHDGPVNWRSRRDWLAILSGLFGLMCSGVGIAMAIVVGIAMLLRRGWRVALLQTGPLVLAYALWSRLSPKVHTVASGSRSLAKTRAQTDDLVARTPVQVMKFVGIGIGTIFGRLTHVPYLGLVLAAVAIVGLVLAVRRDGAGRLRRGYAVPLALLVGAVLFLLLTGVVRSGQPPAFAAQHNIGPGRARQSRYVYVVVAMALPALAIAADAIARRWRLMTIPIVVLLLAGLPGNLHDLRVYENPSSVARAQSRAQILTAGRVPLAKVLSRDTPPSPFKGLTLGWLVDSLPSGRIPPPPNLTPKSLATETLALAVHRSHYGNKRPCFPLVAPVTRPLHLFQSFWLKHGSAFMRYVTPAGVASRRSPFPGKTSIVGGSIVPLDIEIEPAQTDTMLCI